jgi:hypothetical protein
MLTRLKSGVGSANRPVADVTVTMHAVEHLAVVAGMVIDAFDHLLMAADAVGLEHGGVFWPDHDGFVKVLERKTLRMPVTVFRFAEVFGDEAMRRVTVVAGGHGMMRRFEPAIVLIAHDVAVHAGLGIIREIRKTFRIMKRVRPEAGEYADRPHEQNQKHEAQLGAGQLHDGQELAQVSGDRQKNKRGAFTGSLRKDPRGLSTPDVGTGIVFIHEDYLRRLRSLNPQ